MGQLCSCDVQEDAERITPTDFGWEEDDNEDDVFKGDDFNQEEISTQPPSSKNINFDDLSPLSRVSKIQDLEDLLLLCSEGQVAQALTSYEQMEEQANEDGNRKLLGQMHAHPDLADLRVIKKRRAAFFKRLVEPAWKGNWDDSEWKSFVIADPEIDPLFKVHMRMRFARGGERNAAKGGTQILIAARAEGFPVSLLKFAAFHSCVHLIEKEWIKDCERFVGVGAHEKSLYTAMLTSLLAPKILPVKLEDVIFRNFIVCKEAPPQLPGARPGILVMESSPDDKMTSYEGIELPKPRRGVVQITGSEKMNYFMPSQIGGPQYMDVISSIRAQLPIPQWLVPLELVKRFLADIFTGALKQVIEHVASKWEDRPFVHAIEKDPNFFQQVQDIIDTAKS